MWPLSAYSHQRNGPNDLTGDVSFEEARWKHYSERAMGKPDYQLVQGFNAAAAAKERELRALKRCADTGQKLPSLGGQPIHEHSPFSDEISGRGGGISGGGIVFGTGVGLKPKPAFGTGVSAPASSGVFGQPTAHNPGSAFGAPAVAAAGGVFGQQPAPSSVFGRPAAPGGPFGGQLMAAAPQQAPPGVFFGQPAPAAPQPAAFLPPPAGVAYSQQPAMFGQPHAQPASGPGIFGQRPAQPTAAAPMQGGGAIFGQPAHGPASVFGQPAAAPVAGGVTWGAGVGSSAASSSTILGRPAGSAAGTSTGGANMLSASALFGAPAAAAAVAPFGTPSAVMAAPTASVAAPTKTASGPAAPTDDQLLAYQATAFERGKIPDNPPPPELCV